ncbi:MAG TPA: DegT/DnrJ/EryC1/StrS family aminotransferase [Bryobacteraceae bacterium]|jgi:dTDP-4-amino-4,6-dideoxygalactose transaminase
MALSVTAPEVRQTFLPYCLPEIGPEEIEEVVDSLRSGWITTGPKTKKFEEQFAQYCGVEHAIAVNSCTAALHIALAASGVGQGDEVIVPTLTFCSTANVVAHLGAVPVVVDIDRHYQISVDAIERAITPRTKAIIPVHYAGQAVDLDEICALAQSRGIPVIEDAAHASGSEYKGRKIGAHGNVVAFSFYATKNMTTGEGGMITTPDADAAAHMRRLALHGMSRDAWKRYTQAGSWYYEILEPGYKDNMTDLAAALGIHQLRKLDGFNARRRELARRYDRALATLGCFRLMRTRPDRNHVYHLYPVEIIPGTLSITRDRMIDQLKELNIGTSVHFIPLHRHPYYRDTYGYQPEQFPMAERIFENLLSLPLYPKMSDADADEVIEAVTTVALANRA